jgi:hypothetical protein
MRTGWRAVGLLTVAVFAMAACGGGGGESEGGNEDCSGSGISSTELKIPQDFPAPPSVTFTSSTQDGPSGVADGYADEDLETTYNEWHDVFDSAGYTILFDEKEEHDAEISYKSADGTSTGQVALRDECKQSHRLNVHVTDRPA